ncbi:MAG: alkaline phosphatase PhoX [Verrucomicrobiota bacterium]
MKTSTTFAASLLLASAAFGQGFQTSEFSYLTPAPGADFTYQPIITVGDRVGLTGDASKDFAFCGIPDAMGIYKDKVTNENILFVAHEVPSNVNTEPFPGLPKYKGAWVSRFVMAAGGGINSGAPAHSKLFLENTQVSLTPPMEGDARGFTRFCSGAFCGRESGLDRPFFFTNEESGSGNYDGDVKGSQTVAIADGNMYTLPDLGRVARETTVVQPRRDSLTVIMSTEDGNNPSFVYMYVGRKQMRSTSPLDRNGLTNGKVYVLCGRDARHNEGTFTAGALPTKWKEIPNAANLTATQLNTAADAIGGFGFIRVEDQEFDPAKPTRSLFLATTGGSGPNRLGRLYDLTMNPSNPVANGTLNVVYNADTIVTPGGTFSGTVGTLLAANGATGSLGNYTGGDINNGSDFAVSIDNIAVSNDFIVICEDRNSPADAVFAKYARNGGLWTLNRKNGNSAKLQSTFNFAAAETRDGHSAITTRGLWETSGVIRSDEIFGAGTFVVAVQAHRTNVTLNTPGDTGTSIRSNIPKPTGGNYTRAEAVSLFAEDGQVLIVRPVAD